MTPGVSLLELGPVEVALLEGERWKRMTGLWVDWKHSHGDADPMPADVREAEEYVLSLLNGV